MTDFSTSSKVRNANADGSVPRGAWCSWCGNSGVAMLEGSVTVGTIEYSRGSTPCKFCDQGELVFAGWTSTSGQRKGRDAGGRVHVAYHRQLLVATDYTLHDVELTGIEPKRSDRFVPDTEFLREREAAGVNRGALQAMFPRRLWPAEWTGERPQGVLGTLD